MVEDVQLPEVSSTTMLHGASRFFTWTPEEARLRAQPQSAPSNCGATALLNVLSALGAPVPDIRSLERAVHTNSRKHGVSVSEYLESRSMAGCTADDIVNGCNEVAGAFVECRFFPFYPQRQIELQCWLAGWLSQGCSAIATLNMQEIAGADYWHHQMIFGVDADGVHMTNGPELLSFNAMSLGLESPSVLKVACSDALCCCPFDAENCDKLGDEWSRLRVTHQLVHMKDQRSKSGHILIPAAYHAGITIFARTGTPAAALLRSTAELHMHGGLKMDGHQPRGALMQTCRARFINRTPRIWRNHRVALNSWRRGDSLAGLSILSRYGFR